MQHSQNGWSMLIKTYQKGNFVWNFNRLMQQISTGYNWINWYFTRIRTARCCSTSQAILADLRKSTHPRPKKTVTVRHLEIYDDLRKYDDEIWWNMMKFQFGLCTFETKNLIEQESNRKNDAKRSRRRRRRHCHRKNLRTFRTKSIFQDQYSAIFVGNRTATTWTPHRP